MVTGTKRDIGLEIARQHDAKKIVVLIGARDQDRGIKSREKLKHHRFDVHSILLDVTNPMSIQAAVGRIKDEFKTN